MAECMKKCVEKSCNVCKLTKKGGEKHNKPQEKMLLMKEKCVLGKADNTLKEMRISYSQNFE